MYGKQIDEIKKVAGGCKSPYKFTGRDVARRPATFRPEQTAVAPKQIGQLQFKAIQFQRIGKGEFLCRKRFLGTYAG